MDKFVQKFGGKIKGVISGFDRIVFKGCLRPIMFSEGAMGFFRSRGILFKEYKNWVMTQSKTLMEKADYYADAGCGTGITPISSCNADKEKIVRKRQSETGVKQGLIGVWSCVEACSTFKACYDPNVGFPQLRHKFSRCNHLYFYYDHADYGLMSVRLQTWFPYSIQLALNGREWLRRSLDKQKIDFVLHGNKFLHIADYKLAQKLLDAQLDTRWATLLNGFLPETFSNMDKTLGPRLSYYWTLWQSEWATDYIFDSPDNVQSLMNSLLRHAIMTGNSERILRYMGRPVDSAGQPHPLANPEVLTRAGIWYDGVRIRHWADKNSLKLYNEHNNLRFEATVNNPGMFRVFRRPEKSVLSAPKRRMPLRKGIADITLRAQVSADVNRRFIDQMAAVEDDVPIRNIVDEISSPFARDGRKVRALDITGKDRELLLALADPAYAVSGVTNKALRANLRSSAWAKKGNDKQLSARVSRHLRLLRDHGLIRKLPSQRKYVLTRKGHSLTMALNAMLSASTRQLIDTAA